MANKFKTMNMSLPDAFVIQLVFKHISKDFSTFHVNYNTQLENRNVEKLFTMCSQKWIDSRPPMEVNLSSMFSRKTRTIKIIRNFSHLVQIRRNLISVSRSDDDSIDCHFGDGKCEIQFDKECVGLAFRQDKIYLL